MRGAAGAAAAASASLVDELAEREPELAQALVADRRDLEDAVAAGLELGSHEVGELACLGHVDLVECDELRSLEQRHLPLGNRVGRELAQDHVEVAEGVAPGLERRAVHDVQERRAALDVAQELEAEPLALARALDEARHVGHGEAVVAGLHDAEVRMQRGERIVGDLRSSRGERGDEARLARRGEADQRDIRDRLELERDLALEPGRAEQGEAGRLALGARERGVAEAALASGGRDEAHSGLGEVGELGAVGVLHDGADGHGELQELSRGARAVVAHAGLPVLR